MSLKNDSERAVITALKAIGRKIEKNRKKFLTNCREIDKIFTVAFERKETKVTVKERTKGFRQGFIDRVL